MKRSTPLVALLAVSLAIAACGDDSDSDSDAATTTTAAEAAATTSPASVGGSEAGDGTLTLYSGRDEELVGPLIEEFTADTGIEVEVRYGNAAEMGAA
ncbi:MAG: iron ABC transporter substrate-binding protein, partial [Ilumatobacteraceae bacterium]